MTHTATPWDVDFDDPIFCDFYPEERGMSFIVGRNFGGLVAASLPWPTELESGDFSRVTANAAFIVRAANSHHALVEALQWVKAATFTLESYERDYGGELPSNFEIGRIDDSRNSASFRIQVGHIRKLAAALKLAESGQ